MTEEEEKAIEYLENLREQYLKEAKDRKEKGERTGYGTLEDVAKLTAFEIAISLNLIQKQQAEIEKKDKIIDKAIELIEKEEDYYTDKAYEFLEKGNLEANREMILQANSFTKARWVISEFAEEQITSIEYKVEAEE